VPAVLDLAFPAGTEGAAGWGVPMATDIAFALGVLVLLGKRVPVSLKIFLTALAIIDDLGAVAIIALVYTEGLALGWLLAALGLLLILWGLNRLGVRKLPAFLVLGAILWLLVFKSGIHPTLAGVGLALTIPLRPSPGRPDDATSPLHNLEHGLQPWVGYLVLPLFGFANAGVTLRLGGEAPFGDIPIGIAAGLFFGKQLGIFSISWVAIRLRLADCPRDASLMQLYGVSILCGIGFTMSLFIGLLAFSGAPDLQDQVKLGVLAGSLLSALAGTVILLCARREVAAPPAAG
jgi:NhaA family Na+:H+ antiporter